MIKLFWVRVEKENEGENHGFIERIELPDGEVVEFDHQENRIDLMSLLPYVGEQVECYRNNKLMGVRVIQEVAPDDENNGLVTLWLQELPKEKDENEI